MNKKILTALAVLTASTTFGATPSFAVSADGLGGPVQCADGTVVQTNDAVIAEVACADHGGVGRNRVITATGIQTNHAIPPEPNKPHPGKKRTLR